MTPGSDSLLRVVMLGSWPPLPGISSYVHSLVGALASQASVRVLTFCHMYPTFLYPGGVPPEDHTFPPDPAAVVVERSLRWYHPLGWIARGLRTPADVVHVQFWSVPIAPVWWVLMVLFRLRRIPIVLTVHNLAGHESKRMFGWWTRLLVSQADAVITHLPEVPPTFDALCRRRRGRSPDYVPHGPLDLYQVRRKPARSLLPAGARGVLFFGSIRPYKGLDVLIEAFDHVADQIPDAWLVIAGRPWEPWDRYAELLRTRSWKDRVVLKLDYVPTDEVADYFEACALVVAPYREFHSQSGVGLSAVGMGKPLLVTRVGGLPELQPLAEYVVSAGNPEELGRALRRALTQPGELDRLRQVAERVAGLMSWEVAGQETMKIYRGLLPNGAGVGFGPSREG
jgi:glycosyltransferase involved in cell wall biosynthesis